VVDSHAGVALVVTGGGAHYSGLQSCGSSWVCPVCSVRVREKRAREIEEGLGRHFDRGGSAVFVTLTMPHDFGDRLGPLMDALQGSWRSVLSGRQWQEDRARAGVVGSIRSTEVTHGVNGWHPHLHVLLLTATPLAEHELARLRARLYGRWAAAMVVAGYRRPTPANGVTLSTVRSRAEVASYTAKVDGGFSVAREVTRHDRKAARRHGVTPFALAVDAANGEVDGFRLWREYEAATLGRHSIQWSRGLKAELGVVELSDDELAAEDQGGEVVARLTVGEWRYTLQEHLDTRLLDVAADERRRALVLDVIRAGAEAARRRAREPVYLR
jgi:hypothetical protein